MNPARALLAVLLLTPLAALLGAPLASVHAAEARKPNLLYILCDDLGYGDVKCLGGERSKIATPNLDRLAGQGMVFTDAHSSSAVCTPTRYGILTGRYNWRSRLQRGVLGGFSEPLIAPDRLTVPALLRQHGYATACIGKWHLGMTIDQKNPSAPVADGPTTRGFDYYFGISASLDMPPFAFIENDRFTEAPTTTKQWGRKGPAAPSFEAVDVLPTLTQKAIDYIGRQAKANQPFFLYLPLASPHTPIVPTAEWRDKSGLNAYGDFVMQTDASVGRVLDALDQAGIASNTLIMFTSDNGCSPAAKVEDLVAKGHHPSELRRGYKADIWDGGHRVPFIARWPGMIAAGSRTDQLTCLTDLMATAAEVAGAKLPDNAGGDSVSMLPVMLGTVTKPVREAVVHHSISGVFAIRQGPWKLDLCKNSGGWSKGGDVETPAQLYDMSKDVGERANEYQAHPEVVSRLTTLLEKYVRDGRSTPGPSLTNDVPVEIWKKQAANGQTERKKKRADASDRS
jgi:arylsulfatase A-like enzyme